MFGEVEYLTSNRRSQINDRALASTLNVMTVADRYL
jgi:hypothetical protein